MEVISLLSVWSAAVPFCQRAEPSPGTASLRKQRTDVLLGEPEPRGDGGLESRRPRAWANMGPGGLRAGPGASSRTSARAAALHRRTGGQGWRTAQAPWVEALRPTPPMMSVQRNKPSEQTSPRPTALEHVHSLRTPKSKGSKINANNRETVISKKPQFNSVSEEDNRTVNSDFRRTRL